MPATNLKMLVGLIKFPHYLIKFPQESNICMYIHTNARKNEQKFEKFPQEAITIDEVKCKNKLGIICLQKSTFVRYYFSLILKIYMRQIIYLEMNRPTRFQGEKLVCILIGGAVWLDKENKIK